MADGEGHTLTDHLSQEDKNVIPVLVMFLSEIFSKSFLFP